jgi:hypothetical protein
MAKMSVAEHLRGVHKALGEHHARMAKLAKGRGDKDAQDEHESMSNYHTQEAEKCAQGMTKAMGDDDPNSLVPDRISGVITPVPRYGAPQMTKAAVDPMFAHLVEVEE